MKNTIHSLAHWLTTITLLLTMVLFGSCHPKVVDDLLNVDIEQYEPIDEFAAAYNALSRPEQSDAPYDIEQTIRIIHAMELAQAKSENFDEFLDYMAGQDYSGVAQDVLEAKCKLFPLLEYTYKLQRQYEQMDNTWMLMRSLAQGGEDMSKDVNFGALTLIMNGDMFALLEFVAGSNIDKSLDKAFSSYEQDRKLKGKVREDLEKLRGSYRNYLEYYVPIYKKYMKEYDGLCVEKDQAYFDLYAGRFDNALVHTQNILRKYPNNAEAMLLQSMGLILGCASELQSLRTTFNMNQSVTDSLVTSEGFNDALDESRLIDGKLWAAKDLLQQYINLYPDRTAPALVLEGLLCQQLGDEQTALLRFNQAAAEYPRQAERLTDMLDAYNMRFYLTKTPEGQYLRRLYASTMEGYGLFSPNLLKAMHFARQGNLESSRKEIYNHFFRRGNQGIYDELLSDMQFCEENLYGPFKSLLLEQSYLDVSVEPKSKWIFWDNDHVVRVSINNRTDRKFENVRIFLCIHYTDMYKDEYDVVKVAKSSNIIEPHSTVDLGTVELCYPGKNYDDITRIRAIAMTDDRICWIDDVDFKKDHALSNKREENKDVTQLQKQALEEYINRYSLEPEKLQKTLRQGITVLAPEEDPAVEQSWWKRWTKWMRNPDNEITIELPRALVMADPVFSINPLDKPNTMLPEENYLSGTSIHLQFDYEPKYKEVVPLYIYTDAADYRVDIIYKGGKSTIKDVVILRQ